MIPVKTAGKTVYTLARAGKRAARYLPGALTGLGVLGFALTVAQTPKAAERAKEAHTAYQQDGNRKRYIRGYVRAYAPVAASFGLSTGLVLTGHKILRGRYLAVGGALQASQRAFAQYRERVVADMGADKDLEYRTGQVREVSLAPDENGEMQTVTVGVLEVAPLDPKDIYLYVFDERNPYCDEDRTQNVILLREALKALNNHLIIYKDVDLMEALENTGFKGLLTKEQKQAARETGWIWRPDCPDGHISFGPQFEAILRDPRDYIMGRIPNIILDFNVDGPINDKVKADRRSVCYE